MTRKRIIDISELPAHLSIKNSLLVVRVAEETHMVPLHQIGAVIVSSAGVVYTHAVLSTLADANIPFVCCDAKHQPVGLLLSLHDNSIQTQRMRLQIQIKPVVHKRLWQAIIQAKIQAQAVVLQKIVQKNPLHILINKVSVGDSSNMEAQAARIYWQTLFGNAFLRDSEQQGINSMLNYGYAIVRAIVARNLVALGLHPAFGIHHHNKYDAFPLANDIMEPFRPLVDEAVAEYVYTYAQAQQLSIAESDEQMQLTPTIKKLILQRISARFWVEGAGRRLEDVISITCDSLLGVYLNTRLSLIIPAMEYDSEQY